jgi:predicted secreted protein
MPEISDNNNSMNGGFMTKRILSVISLLLAGTLVFAGDAASFIDLGFSSDGRTYIFGQYGKTDKKFQAYAEIYTVDVARNDFVSGDVFITPPSASSGNRSSLTVFEELKQRNSYALSRYSYTQVPLSNILYLRENESKPSQDLISFEDFERITSTVALVYEIRLITSYEGSGKNVQSTLDIEVATKDLAGNLVDRIYVGNPSIKRKGVSGYAITKVFTDPSGRSIVIVIEKSVIDDTGTSIRYMVETFRRD